MSEAQDAEVAAAKPTAGRLLREAREKQGLHIAALAAAIKVSQKKLELLEADRFGELPDATFTRALAQTVCRALKTDPTPVMQLLPPPAGHRLEHVGEGLNTPFRERPGALVQRDWTQTVASPVFWIVGLILVATAAMYLLPASIGALSTARPRVASVTPARAAVEPGMPPGASDLGASAASPLVVPAASSAERAIAGVEPASFPSSAVAVDALEPGAVGAKGALAASAPTAVALPPGMLQLRSSAASWVEVTDAQGKALVSRLLRPGETVGVDGTPPLKLRIGNASGTQVIFRGQPTELQAFTRDNVARLELK
jgi:cytoskeleton protein RodZ